jgi:hypothetical protein
MEETLSVNTNRETNSSLFKTDEKVKKTVSFGSEIWSDGTVRSRVGWMMSSHVKVRSDKGRRFKGIPDEVMCSEETREVEATPDFGNDSSRASPTPSESGSENDQEILREARELILSAKLLLLSLEQTNKYRTEEVRVDEDVSVQSDSMQVEQSHQDETRDEQMTTEADEKITEALDDNLEYNGQNESDSMVEVNLDTQVMLESNVDQIKQRIVFETTPLPEKDGGFTIEGECPSPPAIRRVFLKDGLKATIPQQYPTMTTTKVLSDETRSLVGLSVIASDQIVQRGSGLKAQRKQSSSTSDGDTISSLSADPVPKTPRLSSSAGSVSVAERVRRWSQTQASVSARGNMDALVENRKGFFWRSHPNQDLLETKRASE